MKVERKFSLGFEVDEDEARAILAALRISLSTGGVADHDILENLAHQIEAELPGGEGIRRPTAKPARPQRRASAAPVSETVAIADEDNFDIDIGSLTSATGKGGGGGQRTRTEYIDDPSQLIKRRTPPNSSSQKIPVASQRVTGEEDSAFNAMIAAELGV